MKVVIDCSVLLAYMLEDESEAVADAIFSQASAHKITLIAPSLLLTEACNGLVTNVRRKRINKDVWQDVMTSIIESPIGFHYEVDIASAGRLAVMHHLSVYDATYLACAIKYDAKLSTLDASLSRAAKKEKVDFKL